MQTAIDAFSEAVLGYFDWEKKDYEHIPVNEQVEVFSLIGDIALEGARPRRNRRTALQFTAIVLAILRGKSSFKSTLSKETHIMDANQDRPCHRVCHCRSTASAVRRRGDDRGNAERWDDGERSDGWNQLDVASHLACRRTRYRAFLGHVRKEVKQAAGPLEASST